METKTGVRTTAGLWIDHRKAVIVAISSAGETQTEIMSNVEAHLGRLAAVNHHGSYEDRQGKSEQRQLQEFTAHIDKYYDQVIAALHTPEAILIFGPGEAKGEFKKHLEHAKFNGRIVGVEAADKMTDGQIAAKVRARFHQ